MGIGDGKDDSKLIDKAVEDLTLITGQKAIKTKAKKAISGFEKAILAPEKSNGDSETFIPHAQNLSLYTCLLYTHFCCPDLVQISNFVDL